MESGPDLDNLKSQLLKQLGTPAFPLELRTFVKTYLSSELLGYRILSSDGKVEVFHWNEVAGKFDRVLDGAALHFQGTMQLSEVCTGESVDLVSVDAEVLKSIFYRAICYHHLLLGNTEEQELLGCLTMREYEILREIIGGADNREIGIKFGIRYRTVEKHCENIYRKMGVEHRNSLLQLRLRHH